MNEESKWVLTCLIIFVIAFTLGFVVGVSEGRSCFSQEVYIESESWEVERVIDYNAPFNDSVYGIGGIQR